MRKKKRHMRTKIFSKVMMAAVLLVSSVLWSACTDTWDDHYGVSDGVMADQESILTNLAADPDLANFYKVAQAVGMTDLLNSPQQLTLWAPVNFTNAQADSVIAVFVEDSIAGKKDDDNKAVSQFFQNHVALYSRTVSSETNDTIAMINGKYMHLVGTSSTSGTLQNNPFSDGLLCNNGMLYKADNVQTFFPNVREYTELQANMDSLTAFLTDYDEYELDEDASVPGGVVDGKTVYLDSVTNLTNEMLAKYGYIQREDSTYYLIVPTDELWKSEYDRYHKYYNYNTVVVNNADSLANVETRKDIMCGRFFNMSLSSRYNFHPEDSLCNTQYVNSQQHNPRQNVYYNPESGILQGLEKVECSNGYIYIDDKGVIEPQTTFFGRKDLEAYMARYFELPDDVDKNGDPTGDKTMNSTSGTYYQLKDTSIDPDSVPDGDDSELYNMYDYISITAKTSTADTEITYTLPSTFSGCYYNIYLVTVPSSSGLPLWFKAQQNLLNDRGVFPETWTNDTYFLNPHPVSEESDSVIANRDVILGQANNGRCYVASTEKVDTILLQAAVQYTYSSAGVDDGVVELKISSFGPSSNTYREKIYTRTLNLNEIIMIPYETEAEALAAQDDLDAFNDEKLEANKKK